MKVKFEGVVRGYSVGDDDLVYLAIDEQDLSTVARDYIHDMVRSFNPTDGSHGFGSRDKPCNVKPGTASYRAVLTPEQAKNIVQGGIVDVEMEVFHVRKVRFFNRRWAGIPEMRYEIESVRPARPLGGSGSKSPDRETVDKPVSK